MILTLDLRFQGIAGAIAAHALTLPEGGFALFDPGPGSTLAHLEAGLHEAGLPLADLRAIFVSHVHLDHAAAAGALARRTGATVIAHPRAAAHLLDPTRLLRSAKRVYGDALEHLWGAMVSVPPAQLQVVEGDERVAVGGAVVRAIDAPGHARHQHAYLCGGDLFPGDACAIRFPGSQIVVPATAPPEIDLAAWPTTLDAFAASEVDALHLPHFGAIAGREAVLDHLRHVRIGLVVWREIVASALALGEDAERITARLEAFLRRAFAVEGTNDLAELAVRSAGPRMSVDGLIRALQG